MTLKQAREAMGLSQRQLDRRAGVSRNTTYNIESGKNLNPSINDVIALVAALRSAGMAGLTVEALEFQRSESVAS